MTTQSTPIFTVTCGRCGQTWQRTDASHDQPLECIFCSGQGRLRLGLRPRIHAVVKASALKRGSNAAKRGQRQRVVMPGRHGA
jgi:hypothetical protein